MKRIGIIIFAALSVALSSCSEEAIHPDQGYDGIQQAPELVPLAITTGTETKTVLSGTTVNWTSDDRIAVFDDLHYRNCFEAVAVNGASAVFEGRVAAKTTDFYAVYPYESAIKADAENIYLTLPVEQQAFADSFAEEHNISIAHDRKTAEADGVDGVVFENKCALLKFKIPAMFTNIVEASFTADNRALVGDMIYSKEEDCFIGTTNGSSKVSLKGQLKGGQTYYFVVSPGEVRGFRLTVKDASGVEMTNESQKSFEAKAGVIQDLGEVKVVVKPRVWAEHIYSGGAHVRTDVWLDLGLPSGMEKYVEEVYGYLHPSGGSVANFYRTFVMSKSQGNVKFPYLMLDPQSKKCIPQGYYVANITYALSGYGYVNTTATVYIPAP